MGTNNSLSSTEKIYVIYRTFNAQEDTKFLCHDVELCNINVLMLYPAFRNPNSSAMNFATFTVKTFFKSLWKHDCPAQATVYTSVYFKYSDKTFTTTAKGISTVAHCRSTKCLMTNTYTTDEWTVGIVKRRSYWLARFSFSFQTIFVVVGTDYFVAVRSSTSAVNKKGPIEKQKK